jgi:hypothetical protein
MRKGNQIAAILLLFGSLISPLAIVSQSRSTFTRTSLAKIDVLSRAAFFEQTIADAARKERVDPLILWTIAYNETRFRPWLTSPKNAQGLMQFMPATATRFGLADPYEPNASIFAAARYVKYLGGLFDWRLESVLAAYNAGEGTVLAYLHGRSLLANRKRINPTRRRTAGGVPPYKETLNYVTTGRNIYRWLETQGKFGGIKKGPLIDVAGHITSPRRESFEEKSVASTASLAMLYDPRTGNRFLVKGREILRAINHHGPVIVSSEVRGLPAQKARSTFAGLPP